MREVPLYLQEEPAAANGGEHDFAAEAERPVPSHKYIYGQHGAYTTEKNTNPGERQTHRRRVKMRRKPLINQSAVAARREMRHVGRIYLCV